MTQPDLSPIVFSEWLPTGVMVHFEGGVSVFFPARFLYEQRDVQPNQIFRAGEATPRRELLPDETNSTPPTQDHT